MFSDGGVGVVYSFFLYTFNGNRKEGKGIMVDENFIRKFLHTGHKILTAAIHVYVCGCAVVGFVRCKKFCRRP